MPRIHILRPGKFRDCKGRTVELSGADLRQIADRYERNAAPVIVGHDPDTGDPAHGWAASLSADSRGLWAEVPRLTPQMKNWIAEGRYRRVSSRLVRKAGAWALDHIGMLGARTPAVSGLDPVELAGELDPGDVLITEVELAAPSTDESGYEPQGVARVLARALDYVLGRNDSAGGELPASAEGGSRMTNSGSAGGRRQDDRLAAELAAERERTEALERRLAAMETEARRTSAGATVKRAVEAGRLLPRDEAPMTALLAALTEVAVDGEPLTVELAAEDEGGEDRTLSGAAYIGDLLGRIPVQVPLGELSGPSAELASQRSAVPSGAAGEDVSRAALAARGRKIAAERKIPFAEAVELAAEEVQ